MTVMLQLGKVGKRRLQRLSSELARPPTRETDRCGSALFPGTVDLWIVFLSTASIATLGKDDFTFLSAL